MSGRCPHNVVANSGRELFGIGVRARRDGNHPDNIFGSVQPICKIRVSIDAEFCEESLRGIADSAKSSLQFLKTKIRYFVPRKIFRILHTILVSCSRK